MNEEAARRALSFIRIRANAESAHVSRVERDEMTEDESLAVLAWDLDDAFKTLVGKRWDEVLPRKD